LIARARLIPAALAAALIAVAARADWLQPDASYRDAQFQLRAALRDTVSQSANPSRLDTLGVALLRLNRYPEATRVFRRVLELAPGDDAAEAGLGKLALFGDRLAEAESLLAGGVNADPTAENDLMACRVRRGEYAVAAAMADSLEQTGRAEMLHRMAAGGMYAISGAPEAHLLFSRSYPVPLVRVKLNGQSVLMALDTGAGDVLLDDREGKAFHVELLPSQSQVFWSGARYAVRNAVVRRLEIGGVRIDNVPAGVLSLRRYSLEVNPQSERIAGVIGLNLLRRFTPTLDFKKLHFDLLPAGATVATPAGARRVPFEMWGESELTVYSSISAGRRMALVMQTGIPGCGVAAPEEVFDEVGVKAGMVSRMVKGAGTALQGRAWVRVNVPVVSVGPVVKDKLVGWSGAFDSAELWRHGVRRDGALSNDFFRGWRVTIDWAKRELLFEGD
jgi:hypothetical protein